MLASEEFFWRDSEAVVRILQELSGDAGMEARWQLCLRSWDLLLSDLGFPVDTKLRIVQECRSSHVRRARSGKVLDRALAPRRGTSAATAAISVARRGRRTARIRVWRTPPMG